MTPERKKYLDSCSREELAIRTALEDEKAMLTDLKGVLTHESFEGVLNKEDTKRGIAVTKAVIKALKKQLPMKTKPLAAHIKRDGKEMTLKAYGCLTRYSFLCNDLPIENRPNFCPWCGQKLKWEE